MVKRMRMRRGRVLGGMRFRLGRGYVEVYQPDGGREAGETRKDISSRGNIFGVKFEDFFGVGFAEFDEFPGVGASSRYAAAPEVSAVGSTGVFRELLDAEVPAGDGSEDGELFLDGFGIFFVDRFFHAGLDASINARGASLAVDEFIEVEDS